MDMSSTCAMVFNDLVPRAVQVTDKFHVMKYIYQAVRDVRSRSVKELQQQLSRGRKRTDDDRKLLVETEHLRRVSQIYTSAGRFLQLNISISKSNRRLPPRNPQC